jgi:hypothetical protein
VNIAPFSIGEHEKAEPFPITCYPHWMCTTGIPRLARDEIDALADRIALPAARIDVTCHELLADIHLFDTNAGWVPRAPRAALTG